LDTEHGKVSQRLSRDKVSQLITGPGTLKISTLSPTISIILSKKDKKPQQQNNMDVLIHGTEYVFPK